MIDAILPTEPEIRLARQSGDDLTTLLARAGGEHLLIHAANSQDVDICFPAPAVRVLLGALELIGQGNGVTLTPVSREVTTQQAADILMVSRPFFIAEVLNKGKLPFRRVGNRRRVRYDDLVRYQEEEQEIARREKVMLELMAETEHLGLYT